LWAIELSLKPLARYPGVIGKLRQLTPMLSQKPPQQQEQFEQSAQLDIG
jgi:hypothetical protein